MLLREVFLLIAILPTAYSCGLTQPRYIKYDSPDNGTMGTGTATAPAASPAPASSISFAGAISPLMNAKCSFSGCHVSGGYSPNLEAYPGAKAAGPASLNRIQGRGSVMPPAYSPRGALTDEQKTFFEDWAKGGYQP